MSRYEMAGKNLCRRLLVLSGLALALGAGAAQAQKFAIIDMQQAVLGTSDGKKASLEINQKFAPLKAQLDQLAKDVQTKQDQFAKDRATMTPAQVGTAQTEIESLTTSLKRKQEDAQQDLEDEESRQLGGIVPKLQQVISEYATANQITIVLDTSAGSVNGQSQSNLIFGDASINIIAPVVEAYEKATAKSVTPAAKAPAAAPAKPAAVTAPKAPATVPRTPVPAK